jgi:hypothetical protein
MLVLNLCEDSDTSSTDAVSYSVLGDTAGKKKQVAKPPPCPPAQYPSDADWEKFKKALCFTETGSKDDPSCKDGEVGSDGDTGRYQMTPIFVRDIFDYYCNGSGRSVKGSGEYSTVCEELKAMCKSVTVDSRGKVEGDSSCLLNNSTLSERMLDLWFKGRYSNEKKKKSGESWERYLYRMLQMFHCGLPNRNCGGLTAYPPKGGPPPCGGTSNPCDFYYFKFYCKWKSEGGPVGPGSPPFPANWCDHYI